MTVFLCLFYKCTLFEKQKYCFPFVKFNWQWHSKVAVSIHVAYINILHCVPLLQRRTLSDIQSFLKTNIQYRVSM